ncbi:HipA domain-containing protein [Porphyromonas circumdentaria]|uniref:HipA-like C-terminal domain-containing protein n=1 Tax=Porphyromonas circumdentaria TaxID=29524 RepID=A0A1T4LW60_9PORP|nr:hypothetical protein [Porphyromonas circumdentaria]MBB6275402.1 hypothetical protein [Porphyromonas circumdentaria]MDO4722099.1 hypothetical protein [Porphyromonas circumdentaria]SJZ58973.1 hypothetical protein SAMN02745171_00557 [Porphyromonas circumdentaria]
MLAQIVDVSQWTEQQIQAEGTRDKNVLISPEDGKTYYFKKSLNKMGKSYPFEFWSEIVASKIGKALGFSVADYNLGIITSEGKVQTVGALVESVHALDEELVSGYSLIVQYYPLFSHTYKEEHRLELILRTLKSHGLEKESKRVFECMLFDAIIGNTDRHSENWAFIITDSFSRFLKNLEEASEGENAKSGEQEKPFWDKIDWVIKKLISALMRFSPLYDNGSSLGREIVEDKIVRMVHDSEAMEKYILSGKPDIRVVEKKISFLETIKYLLSNCDYEKPMREVIQKMRKAYHRDTIRFILDNVDRKCIDKVPEQYRLSKERKEFMYRLITERIERIIKMEETLCAI